VLGESVVATVGGLDTGSSTAGVVVALLGFVNAASVWWVYFGRWRSMPGSNHPAGFVWAQGHFLVFAGIAAAAVGVELAVEAAAHEETLEFADRLPLTVGLAAYLVAMAMIRAATRRPDWVVALRVGAAAALLVLSAVELSAVTFVAVATALFFSEAVVEMTRAPAPAGGG
jgi:low temperature requirement protein LtrA